MFLAALLAAAAPALLPGTSFAAASAEGVALQYHFAGAADLAGNTNFSLAAKIFSLPSAKHFQDLVLDRWAGVFWNALQFDPGGDSAALLRPMLNDLLQADSTGCFGGHDKNQMDFVLAVRLDAKSAAEWQKNLETTLHGPGEPMTAEGFAGRRWDRPGHHSLRLIRANDWTVASRGEDLLPVRTAYLRNIKNNHQPLPVPKENWLAAEVDWPLLAAWVPLSNCPFRLARTSMDVTAGGGRFRTTVQVTYPEAVPWKSQPWRFPKELVCNPMSSFTAAQNIGAYLNTNHTEWHLSSNPLTNQLFCWASREMVLQSCAAWPVANATNALRKLGAEAPALLNPFLEARNHSQLNWLPKDDRLAWSHMQLTAPSLGAASDTNGDFLLAKVFPLESKRVPPPDQFWNQFQQRGDLVYYDLEMTGERLKQWRLLAELLPVFPPPTPEDDARHQKAAKNAKPSSAGNPPQTPMFITEAWLAELSSPALNNTFTEVTRISPTQLAIVRSSQFLFTGLELVLLSHWLADAPVGPIDYSLLPQAKMTGPGLPKPH
jgi:hypothetical protein